MSPKDGDLQSKTMLLNGIQLQLTEKEGIPNLQPIRSRLSSPLYISSLSISFIVFPNFDSPACA
ncbi:unnamed protein product [Linum tenue]|nr:unnamed protein product [Linum tenue]CAI0560411.1 unnamed protein product [Linum tenue]CAI0560424.1 unnamed protein product [Linum tenue]